MASSILFVFLGLLRLTLSLPVDPTQTVGRLTGNSFGLPGQNVTYDYIIVGGGTAGLTIAERLSENPSLSVAVIEAGGFYEIESGNFSQVPGYDTEYVLPESPPSLVDWGFVTQPQKGYNNREVFYARGKTLGGSSALNLMIYQRATVGAFKLWAQVVGDNSWLWNTVYSFYKKSTQFTPPNLQKIGPGFNIEYDQSAYSPQGGPLQVSFSNYQQPPSPYLAKGMKAAGISAQDGLNSGILNGYAATTVEVDPTYETRSSSETSFLQTAFTKTGLKVYPSTLAKQILFDATKKATGVTVVTGPDTYTLSASKEVIVSAGAFQSPQLLMVSGIGPAATLEANNIPAISTLEGVGQNLWDQVFFTVVFQVNQTTNSQLLTNPAFGAAAAQSFLNNQSGPLTSVGVDLIGWEKLPEANRKELSNTTLAQLAEFPSDWPEIEYIPIDIAFPPADAAPTDNYLGFAVALLTPLSRGTVTINSTDTSNKPLINPNWLVATADQEVAVQAFKRIRQIAGYSGVVISEINPGTTVQSDAEILTWIQNNASPIWHASATCAMGNSSNPNAVLDSKARVKGVSGLRVVDASSFPFLPPGHPSSSIYMLAEKIANDVLTGS